VLLALALVLLALALVLLARPHVRAALFAPR